MTHRTITYYSLFMFTFKIFYFICGSRLVLVAGDEEGTEEEEQSCQIKFKSPNSIYLSKILCMKEMKKATQVISFHSF